MSKRKPDVYLQDILESIEYIQRFLDGVSEDEFYENVEKQDAVLRRPGSLRWIECVFSAGILCKAMPPMSRIIAACWKNR